MSNKSCAIFGEVLFDEFPDGLQVLGGAPFNVAWHMQAFGLAPSFISRVGCDVEGEKIKQAMQDWGMSTAQLQTDTEHPTGKVQISFQDGEPCYDIVANQAYDFIDANQMDLSAQYNVLYHGTLALRSETCWRTLEILKAQHHAMVFVDVNLRAPWWQRKQVEQLVNCAHWVKLNHEELQQLQPSDMSLKQAMVFYLMRFNLRGLVVTCGEQGAIALNQEGEFIEVKPAEQLDVVDTVGAGDAFSAVLLLGLQRGWKLAVIMERAQSFASALVTQRGATVQDLGFYQAFIDAWK